MYQNLTVVFINARNPDLVVFDDDERERKRLDLTTYANVEEIHKLLKNEGFETKQAGGLADDSPECVEWAQLGECAKNSAYMMSKCKLSCSTIKTELR